MKKRKPRDVAWGFFHGNISRSISINNERRFAIAERWASKALGLNPTMVFVITPPKPKRGRTGR